MKQQKDVICQGLKEELNKRNVGGDPFQASNILDQVTHVYEKIMDVVENKCLGSTNINQMTSPYEDNFIHVSDRLGDEDYGNQVGDETIKKMV